MPRSGVLSVVAYISGDYRRTKSLTCYLFDLIGLLLRIMAIETLRFIADVTWLVPAIIHLNGPAEFFGLSNRPDMPF